MNEIVLPLALSLGGWLVWNLRLSALARTERRLAPTDEGETETRVSVVVPARNEAHNLPALLESLHDLSPRASQVIVVDDHSTDGTGDIARSTGSLVVRPDPLPRGWLGKPWACARGAAEAQGDLLLFTDADTVHAPGSLRTAVAFQRETQADLVSVVPTHVAVRAWEHMQGVFQLVLLVATRAGSPRRSTHERDFCIGQYLLFRREAYDRAGRHESVRDRVAEDLAFARRVRESGGRYALLFAPGALRVRMYPEGFGAFVRGWRRNFREGISSAGASGLAETVAVMGWLLGAPVGVVVGLVMLPAWGPAHALVNAAFTLLAMIEVARHQRRVGNFSPLGALAYPLFVVVFVCVTALAAWDRLCDAPVRWRGRSIARGAL